AINTRKKDEKGSTWRENKLGLVFSSENLKKRKDGVTQDILQKEYVSSIGKVDEFKKQLFECAVRNGYGEYRDTVIISDGATWIRNMSEELLNRLEPY
ncbi:MAG: ISKra4 family transposase, partial [Treponema sp.]|nr:ISKra4 family transposase [Treponema sp.]